MAPFYPRRFFLALALALFLPTPATAKLASNARWHKRVVPVIDMSSNLGGYVEEKVALWNAALAGTRLRLDYRRGKATIDCHNVGIEAGAIRVCNTDRVRCDGPADGCAILDTERTGKTRRRITGVRVVIGTSSYSGPHDQYGWPYGCHEIGHALGLNHRYGDPDSCMGIERDTPGAVDITALRAMYGKRKKRR